MNENTNLSVLIDATEGRNLKLDKNIKEFLSDTQILARIAKYTVQEVQHLSIDEIIKCIDYRSVKTGIKNIDPGLTNIGKVQRIQTENSIPGEGYITFDIVFDLVYNENIIKVIVNIEAQKSADYKKLGYHLENRVVFYLARLISSQKETEFFHSNYDDIKKVYSIWICMDAEEGQDGICKLSLCPKTIFGSEMKFPQLDKMCGIIIRIRKDDNISKSKNKLIAMLEDLLVREESQAKKEMLVREYGMVMTYGLERRVDDMCNLSEVIIENAVKQGLEQGLEQGAFEAYASLVRDGLLSMEEAARRMDMSVEALREKMETSN